MDGPRLDAPVDALVDAAADGVNFDGLRVAADGDEYRLSTPETTRTGLSTAELRDAAADVPRYVDNWHYWTREVGRPADAASGDRAAYRFAFLRWLERADGATVPERYETLAAGVAREWGQLRLSATLDSAGRRRSDARHVDDADADPAALDVHEDPLDARDIVTYDERGRYRPLKTAPTLRRGWCFPDLDGPALVETVDQIYPATVANWHLEREGALDVTHWREAAERQTGIYEVVDELPAEAVNWMAEACCVDSQCLKRREWDEDETTPLDPPRGEGEFPCREPCSLVVAAARTWTQLEGEETHTYEFDLTPSEREQVVEIIDAVADGRVDEIREADLSEGANRYRARYLRAKRFDEAGDRPETE